MSALLRIAALRKHFPLGHGRVLQAVDGVTLEVAQGEVVGLVGESGCGKSTLGRAIAGLHDKTSGEVRFRGEPLPGRYGAADFRRWARKIQMIFQDPYSSLDPRMTLREIVAEGPRIHGTWPRGEVQERVAAWLERVGLSPDQMSRYPHELSGGQRQRIGIARALALEPELVICDEPISALDVSVQAQVVNLLAGLRETMGLTLLFIAHDLSMVRYVSDLMAVMYLGRLVELGRADDVYFRPRHPYTQSLIASNPVADPEAARRRGPTAPRGEVPSPVNLAPGCRFAGRCPFVMDVCRAKDPEWREIEPGRFVSCFLYDGERAGDERG
ncbi:MAG TPA: ABC transporter ATP-binding protein [Anaeromyxobacteraceae bacterium]|nr:ABC transporter ATP-binding protein [Anaeromyxobacteraceae bacterium]